MIKYVEEKMEDAENFPEKDEREWEENSMQFRGKLLEGYHNQP